MPGICPKFHDKLSAGAYAASVVLILTFILGGCGPAAPAADLVLLNGAIITVDDSRPEAQALAVDADTILAVGSNDEIRGYIGDDTKVIDLGGKTAIPGFIDSHAHFLNLGYARMRLGLTQAKNWDEVVAIVARAAEERQPGEWITGRGWHQDKWDDVPEPNVDGLPYHIALSRVSPNNPVILTHASGHACIANAKAMELAGISGSTPDPDGGTIVRDAGGEAIGVFREAAQSLVYRAQEETQTARTPEEKEAETIRAIELATRECLENGVTSFHDAGEPFETIDLFKRLAEEGKLGIRLWVMIGEDNDSLAERLDEYRIVGAGNGHLTVLSIKRYIDGALGSHGAWLLEPYEDMPSSSGLNVASIEYLSETARMAARNGFQLCIHAIGDRGNREVLNIYEETFSVYPKARDARWRIEHAQHIHPDDIPRFSELGLIAAMQGIHCTSDGPWVPKRIGDERAEEGAYVWRKLIRSGAVICNGTDAPVENIDPIANFHALVTRQLPDGSSFYPDQRMSREEALRAYTINGAYAAFEEHRKGSLTPGKLADIVILSDNIMTVPEGDIPSIAVVATIVGGRILYDAEDRD